MSFKIGDKVRCNVVNSNSQQHLQYQELQSYESIVGLYDTEIIGKLFDEEFTVIVNDLRINSWPLNPGGETGRSIDLRKYPLGTNCWDINEKYLQLVGKKHPCKICSKPRGRK